MSQIVLDFWENFRHGLFKPILLFFYMGFLVPILRVKLDFPHIIYQGLTIFLLLAIGWHGGEELANLSTSELARAGGFMIVGFCTNFVIGLTAYFVLKKFTKLRRIDAATVAGYYGSDSAGTFATATGFLLASKIAFAPYMPVLLAVMEIPGCLIALFLVSSLRRQGMDPIGNMPYEQGYDPSAAPPVVVVDEHGHRSAPVEPSARVEGVSSLENFAVQTLEEDEVAIKSPFITPELLHEVFLNPGIFLLVAGIVIGFISKKQGDAVTRPDDTLFLDLFPGLLCLFLLEMGMTASRKLKDLKTAGWRFIAFALIAPNVFATMGILIAHAYCTLTGIPQLIGTYVLFAVLCGAASYIAVPAIQRLVIPEASPTLPLAASLGLTFTYNVTIGIPLYIEVSKFLIQMTNSTTK